MSLDTNKLLEFYKKQVYGDLMPYWMRQVDHEYGGVLNCLSNRGDKLLYDHKFVWSQGRWAWQTSRIYEESRGKVDENTRESYRRTAADTVRFLMTHARLENGNCAFVLSRDGNPIILDENGSARTRRENEVYDYSISADIFALVGVAEYARVMKDETAYKWAKDLYLSCKHRKETGTARSDYPYPIPDGYRSHAKPMDNINKSNVIAPSSELFGDKELAESVREDADKAIDTVLNRFVQPSGLVLEHLGDDYQPVNTLLGRYVNPGHTIEDMWFIMHRLMEKEDTEQIEQVAEVSRITLNKAWDELHGGIPQFMGIDGKQPQGPLAAELEEHPMIVKLKSLWDKKLWWPHSEALYALILLNYLTNQKWIPEAYNRMHEYTFSTFPNPDKSIGEWIQIRDRQGKPEEAVVALPVKDPMHIVRAFLFAINVLEKSA